LAAIDKVLTRIPQNVTMIPGHGEVSDLAGLKAFRQYIQDVVDAAKKAKASSMSKDDFLKTKLPQYKDWKGYDDRLNQNLEAAWETVQ
jgi:hypothetical protein